MSVIIIETAFDGDLLARMQSHPEVDWQDIFKKTAAEHLDRLEDKLTVSLTIDRAYEGDSTYYFSSRREAVAWLKSNRSSYDYSLDNVTARDSLGDLDVYEMMKDSDQ